MARLEIRSAGDALLGQQLATGLRGLGSAAVTVRWRARVRDDDGALWESAATTASRLGEEWSVAGGTPGAAFAGRSLRPLQIELRADAGDGRAATRTVTRRMLTEGARVRRWRGERATLYLPAVPAARTLLIDAGAGESDWLAPAAALLASGGAVVLAAGPGADVERLAERLATVPGAPAVERVPPPPPPAGLPVAGRG